MSTPGGRTYPIRVVARLTGLSLDTLRAWERRYEAVVPKRDRRGRVYSDADVARLKQLGTLVERGHAIGSVAALTNRELARLIDGGAALTAVRADLPAPDFTSLIAALDRYDLATIEAVLARHAAVLPTRELVFAVILPLLRELGDRWEAGTLSPAQEHLVSAIVRTVLGGLLRAFGQPGGARVVFATPAGERHELCLLCAAVLTAAGGGHVIYLGPDLPAADIRHVVVASGARLVVMSATTPGAVSRSEVRALATALSDVDVWVGGPQSPAIVKAMPRGEHVQTLADLESMWGRRAKAR